MSGKAKRARFISLKDCWYGPLEAFTRSYMIFGKTYRVTVVFPNRKAVMVIEV